MHELPLSPQLKLYCGNKWAGVTPSCSSSCALGWRHAHRPPALPDAMAGWRGAPPKPRTLLLC